MSEERRRESILPAFSSAEASVRDVHFWHRYRWQTTIGVVLTWAVVIALGAIVATACYLAIQGPVERIAPLLQALQPFLLPPLGAVAGYAFGQHAGSAERSDSLH